MKKMRDAKVQTEKAKLLNERQEQTKTISAEEKVKIKKAYTDMYTWYCADHKESEPCTNTMLKASYGPKNTATAKPKSVEASANAS
mmetsp:Transcript_46288/g.76579  ORF Transcript_46288/g.76579 Transcript_46288/m.76579 type:complete len:86 (+) Transcript_46288:339-596(+)